MVEEDRGEIECLKGAKKGDFATLSKEDLDQIEKRQKRVQEQLKGLRQEVQEKQALASRKQIQLDQENLKLSQLKAERRQLTHQHFESPEGRRPTIQS